MAGTTPVVMVSARSGARIRPRWATEAATRISIRSVGRPAVAAIASRDAIEPEGTGRGDQLRTACIGYIRCAHRTVCGPRRLCSGVVEFLSDVKPP
jgi:hypothetical protein